MSGEVIGGPAQVAVAAADVTGAAEVTEATTQENSVTETSGHPAWQPYLDKLPDDLTRGFVKPVFEEWDRSVQERFNKVHSEYEPLKQYQNFVGTDPRQLEAGLQLYRVLEASPQKLYEQLQQHYGFGNGQGQAAAQQDPQVNNEPDFDLGEGQQALPPEVQAKLAQMEQVQSQVVNLLAAQEQQKVEAEANAWLDQQVNTLKTQHGIPDQHINMVLNQVHLKASQVGPNANFDQLIAEAGAEYKQFVESVRGPQAPPAFAPRTVTGSGGSGVPATPVDPKNLQGKDRRQLFAEMLDRSLSQG